MCIRDRVKGLIKSKTDFGIFIELEGKIDGLVHLSDISWDNDEESLRSLETGEEIETVVLSIDSERERISLGIKQLHGDAFNDYIKENPKGSKITGKVTDITEEKIILNLSEGINGTLSQKDFVNSNAQTKLEIDSEMEILIANVNKDKREITLSLRALEKQEERDALKENVKKNQEIEDSSKSNIGDMIKSEINEQKNEEMKHELVNDEKELAEHTMLVDLGRNDIGRVCDYVTVRVKAVS